MTSSSAYNQVSENLTGYLTGQGTSSKIISSTGLIGV